MRIAIAGSSGRMGRTLIECVLGDKELTLSAALEQAGHPLIGKGAGETTGVGSSVAISSDVEAAFSKSDVLIDFTRPVGTLAHLEACLSMGKKMVIGTTGFSEQEKARIAEASKKIAIM